MGTREKRRWIRSWWADQMRNPSVPDIPAKWEGDEFFELWADESAKIARRVEDKDPRP